MSFEIALSGISAINSSLDTISNNIANTGTFGFKSSRANFSSMYAGAKPAGSQIGSQTQNIGKSGGVLTTGGALDAMIQGRGFFVAKDGTGAEVYSRVGIFTADKDGFLIDNNGRKVQGFQAVLDTNGVPIAGAAMGEMGNLTVPTGQISAKATSTLAYVGNLSADWTTPTVAFVAPTATTPADPLSYNGSRASAVYDSLGVQHTVTQYFVKTGSNAITVNYAFDGVGAAIPTTSLTFSSSGQLTSPVTAVPLPLGTPSGAKAMNIDINYTGITQFAGDTTTTVNTPNGYASGTLTGVKLAADGSVMAQYSNNQMQRVGTVALATFASESALSPVSNTSWMASTASGVALYNRPGAGMTGELTVGAIEQSNVDMTSELVSLMSSQRNYQANTKVISTESDMMKSLMQVI
jgi:flagellar hook protein FlgE